MLILEKVQRGQLVAYSGVCGLAAGFPQLHFDVHRLDENDVPDAIGDRDPEVYRVEGPGKVTCYDNAQDYKTVPAGLTYPVPCRGTDWQ